MQYDLKQQWLHALHWVKTQPGLIEGLPGGHDPLMKQGDDRLDQLMRKDAEGLLRLLTGPRTHKVGIAFEALILWGIEQGLGYTCLGKDIQIQDGKRTMGALDLVLRAPDGAIEHWELAYKLFLQCDSNTGWSSWLGPRGRDRLDAKLRKMLHRQLPMSEVSEALQALMNLGVEKIDRRRLIMQGTLFCPWGSPPQRAFQAHQEAQGIWIRLSQIAALTRRYPEGRWIQLHKPFWFGPAALTSQALSTTAFRQAVEQANEDTPQLWSFRIEPGQSKQTLVFIVAEDWGLRNEPKTIH